VSTAVHPGHDHPVSFRHEALFYAGSSQFVDRCGAFIRAGLAADQAMLVAVAAPKIAWLREALGGDAELVQFADMDVIGANPARIIPIWQEFADRNAGRGARGIGEPISPRRDPDELTECQRHEALINVAFGSGPGWWLACPYDTGALHPDVIEEARRSHPVISDGNGGHANDAYSEPATPFAGPLPEPPVAPDELEFGVDGLADVRAKVAAAATVVGLDADQSADLVVAVSEVAANSVCHGGGNGLLRVWQEPVALVCEVQDRGLIEQPLVGRIVPQHGQLGGRGLWLANQLCDLVQIRCSPAGATVRLRMRLSSGD
jgi:anti-sigma regulatory factor (Ser/Thr protein kinase)